jgi:hypothetical protein
VWWPNRTGIPHVENQVEPATSSVWIGGAAPVRCARARRKSALVPALGNREAEGDDRAQSELAKLSVNCIPRGMRRSG